MSAADVVARTAIEQQLTDGLAALDFALAEPAVAQLLDYLELMQKWNKVYNLTAIREESRMVSGHLLDSLAVARYLQCARLLDVGTGPGLPGIPLAIAWPATTVSLLDSNHKKTAFLRQAVTALRLRNARVVCERAEAWQPPERFDAVISRAFAEIGEFVAVSRRLLAPGGTLAAMKGVYPRAELDHLPAGVQVRQVIRLEVPGLDAERHLVLLDCE